MSYCDDDACNEPAHDCAYRDELEKQNAKLREAYKTVGNALSSDVTELLVENTKLREAAQEGLEGLQWAHRMWSAGGSQVAAFKMSSRIDKIEAALEDK
jgi:hypothetical protein